MGRFISRLKCVPLAALILAALSACDGTTVVTLTASQEHFLTYRVGLTSLTLETAGGATTIQALPSGTTVDLARLADFDEVLGAAAAAKGTYATAVITLNYGSAQIVADDGSANGAALTPVDVNGQPRGMVALSVHLDPKDELHVVANRTSSLALNVDLAASNAVDLAQGTVVVTPMIAASALPLDTKPVRIRGPLASVDTGKLEYTAGIAPFDGSGAGAGQLPIFQSPSATYEVNGMPSAGSAGFALLARLRAGTYTEAYGNLAEAASGASGAADLTFTATQVLAGTSVRSTRFDAISGIVTARSGDTLTVPAATLVTSAGANSYVTGTTTVTLSAGTQVTLPAQGVSVQTNGIRQISVGSRVTVFGSAAAAASGDVTLDASAGHVRLADTAVAGIVTAQGNGSLSLSLSSLGGREVAPFSFAGTGSSPGTDANPNQYVTATGVSSFVNTAVGMPVDESGLIANFGSAPPDFAATTLQDETTIPAMLAIDWASAGTRTPFAASSSAEIDLDVRNRAIGPRHRLDIGAQSIDVTALTSNLILVPASAATATVFSIGHAASATIDSFNTFADFAAALQSDLGGTAAATRLTATGTYAPLTFRLSATAVTVILND